MKPVACLQTALCFGLFTAAATCAQEVSTNKLAPTAALNLDAKLVRMTLSPRGDFLYWLNQSDGSLQRLVVETGKLDERTAAVAAGATDFCLSDDGGTVFVAAATNGFDHYRSEADQRGTIQEIKTPDMTVARSFEVPIDPFEIVCDTTGMLYVTPGSGQWVKISKIDPRRSSVLFSFGSIYGQSNLRITPNKRRLYLATNGLSPGDISAVTIPSDSKATVNLYDSPYHGEYPLSGAFDPTPDGKFIVNRAGTVVRLGTAKGSDMVYVTALGANSASACDPAGGRFWLALEDGRLVTYRYPSFELEKTEVLLSPASGLTYDAARSTLWVAWTKTKGGLGGIDAYNFKTPAAYPNDITKAREAARAKPKPAPLPSPASAPAASASVAALAPVANAWAREPAAPEPLAGQPEMNHATVRQDPAVRGLLLACVALFLLALFMGDRTPKADGLRNSTEEVDDPRYWPLPTSIKVIGWFGFFQVLSLTGLVWFLPVSTTVEQALLFARILGGTAMVFAILAFGVLRGSKLFYVGYGLALLAGMLFSISRGMSPGFLTLVLVFAVFHYGRKNWEYLT